MRFWNHPLDEEILAVVEQIRRALAADEPNAPQSPLLLRLIDDGPADKTSAFNQGAHAEPHEPVEQLADLAAGDMLSSGSSTATSGTPRAPASRLR